MPNTNHIETNTHHCRILQLGSVANMSLNKVQRRVVVLSKIVDTYRSAGIGDNLGTARRVLNHNMHDRKRSQVKNALQYCSVHLEMQAILENITGTGGTGMFR